MHRPVSTAEIIDIILYIRDLFRRSKPGREKDLGALERREAATRDLVSNLPRLSDHPTLRTLLEIADIYSLTLDGAHRLFGYNLQALRDCDLMLNRRRTHIFESYPFERDLLIDLPARLAPATAFATDALLRDLVVEWQTDIPLRALEQDGWEQPGAFYIQVGTEDSLGSSLPARSIALVEPITQAEKAMPNPRNIYLLQFGDGYRCTHCVVTNGKLRPFTAARGYIGRQVFAYPGAVRIAGRIRMFALNLPQPDHSVLQSPSVGRRGADLILPWEQPSRDRLLMSKHRRFRRPRSEEDDVQAFLREHLHARLSPRSIRRYRRPGNSDPHVNALMHLALAHMARYTDTLRTGGSWTSDQDRFSLEALLKAKSIDELTVEPKRTHFPVPTDVWEARREEFGSWPPLLSVRFPKLQHWGERVFRLAHGSQIFGLHPAPGPGSLLLLDDHPSSDPPRESGSQSGWSRPIYLFRRGVEVACGYLERNGAEYALLPSQYGSAKICFDREDLRYLHLVTGIAVPV